MNWTTSIEGQYRSGEVTISSGDGEEQMNKLIEQYNKSKKKRLDSRTKSLPH